MEPPCPLLMSRLQAGPEKGASGGDIVTLRVSAANQRDEEVVKSGSLRGEGNTSLKKRKLQVG